MARDVHLYVFKDGCSVWSRHGPTQDEVVDINEGVLTVFRAFQVPYRRGTKEARICFEKMKTGIWYPVRETEIKAVKSANISPDK